jgi:transposase
LEATMTSAKAMCPDCCQPTDRIHGHYPRTLADLPWATAPIELRVIVRRFRCCTCTCRRQTFAERLPDAAVCAYDDEIGHDASQHGAGLRRRCRRAALVTPQNSPLGA